MHRYMLDTNIVIYVIKRRPIEVLERFNANVGRMVISSITLAELVHGAEKSAFFERNLRTVEDFISRLDVLSYDQRAAFHYGSIRADLEKKGTPIGLNDLHIAAHARSEALTLITNNLREFSRVNGLISENWL
ncbi:MULTISPECIES: type II toxin-antitoxin system tRNA(fMet)-specific endonuclease VapC [unclassified Pantoea]|uniref:type II toxin-antitoxin system tRNA(fMet)-specific endonuclease VapC n=1 Tax=unclassified Pantoea TaxID=2630326 RepID=UPI001CD55C24|nr:MULTISPECIES: type II toxin-antitoxin system VapC family toxin [unclassified Pantoea]MCA1176194.1 type II toxin-antitoxin system VapC family toxin [Pantoea sp. alder69]MCA1249164.1 type II toxin-antitoxin system VapC family toxin [Pantoea sp. alder70]MCA1264761.1 type II toxin-antitoxin system VapC family toxin [Pantoea sp. alder81]